MQRRLVKGTRWRFLRSLVAGVAGELWISTVVFLLLRYDSGIPSFVTYVIALAAGLGPALGACAWRCKGEARVYGFVLASGVGLLAGATSLLPLFVRWIFFISWSDFLVVALSAPGLVGFAAGAFVDIAVDPALLSAIPRRRVLLGTLSGLVVTAALAFSVIWGWTRVWLVLPGHLLVLLLVWFTAIRLQRAPTRARLFARAAVSRLRATGGTVLSRVVSIDAKTLLSLGMLAASVALVFVTTLYMADNRRLVRLSYGELEPMVECRLDRDSSGEAAVIITNYGSRAFAVRCNYARLDLALSGSLPPDVRDTTSKLAGTNYHPVEKTRL